jgi:hypothetical protein
MAISAQGVNPKQEFDDSLTGNDLQNYKNHARTLAKPLVNPIAATLK